MPELPSPPQSNYKAVRGDVEADPFSGEMHIVGAKEWLLDITGTLTDYVLPEGIKNGDLLSFRLTGNVTLNSIVPPVQGFWCRLGVRDQSGGNYSLIIKDTLEAGAGTAIYQFNTPGSAFGDANPDDFTMQSEEAWCTIVYASLSKRWKILATASSSGGGGGTPGWDDVLAVDPHSGANNPIVDTSQFLQFGTSAPTQITGQIRSNSNFLIHADVGIEVHAHDDIYIHGPDTILLESTGGSQVRALSSASVKLESTASEVVLEASTYVDIVNGFLRMQEQAASTPSMIPGKLLIWPKDTASPGNELYITDDTNTDYPLFLAISENGASPLANFSRIDFDDSSKIAVTVTDLGGRQANVVYTIVAGSIALSDLASQAADTFVGRLAGSGSPTAQLLADIDSTSLVYDVTSHTFQRAALTGAITASQDSNTTAFGALAAKSVLANATNSSAVPAALAGSAAFQHLRVNSANTGLEWSILTAGDFPAGVVPLTGLATQAAETFLGNFTAGVASPTALAGSTVAGAGLTYTTGGILAVGAGTGITVNANDVQLSTLTAETFFGNFTAGAAVGTARLGTSVAGAGLTYTAGGTIDVGSSTSIIVGASDIQRAAITGDVTSAQNSNATAFRSFGAKSVLANATNAGAVPSDLAGTAAFQHLRVNSANTGLEWSILTAGDFPAGVVPLTGLSTQAAETFLGNFTAGVASPTALAGSTVAGAGLTYTTGGILAVGAGTGITVNANDVQLSTIADDTFMANVSGGAAVATGKTFSSLAGDRLTYDATNHEIDWDGAGIYAPGPVFLKNALDIGALTTTSIIGDAVDTGGVGAGFSYVRAALTGAITAIQDSNATAFGALAAKSVLANATNGSAVPAALAGSAAFQHLRVNSANNALEWSILTTGDFPASSIPLSAFPTQAAGTVLANITAGVAVPTAHALSTFAGGALVYTNVTGVLDVVAGAGASLVVGASDIQRGALTGAITASQDSNATAFGVLAAKSVLANATNGSAVPAALAGSAAFQHLRVNSANTGLEWSILTAGDFPAGVVPLTGLSTQAAETFLGNFTAGVASPTALAGSTVAGAGLTYTTGGILAVGAGTGITVNANDVQLTTIADDTFMANVSGGAAVATGKSFSSLSGDRLTYDAVNHEIDWDGAGIYAPGPVFLKNAQDIGALSTTSIIGDAIDTGGVGAGLSYERAALTGAITATQNSNATAFGVLAAKSVLANATNGSAVPAALAGSAAFQHLRVNSANNALEWSLLTAGDFPAGVVPLTGLATQAAETFTGNFTAGVASPTALAGSTVAGAGLTYTTGGILAVGAGTGITVNANDVQLSALAAETFFGNFTAGSAVGVAVAGSTVAGAGLTYTTGGILAVGSSTSVIVGANDVQRAALTGDVTSAQNSNATAFRSFGAKSVLANATNAGAVPSDLAGSAAFQHLRVNSANTGLEWSILTAGDFPAGVVPLTGVATQAAETFNGNFTAGVASPTALAGSTVAGAGLTYTTGGILAVGAGTRLTVNANDVQLAAGAAESFLMNATAGSAVADYRAGSSVAGGGLTYTAGGTLAVGAGSRITVNANDIAWAGLGIYDPGPVFVKNALDLGPLTTTSIIGDAVDTGGSGAGFSYERAALTGPITAAQNSNATSIASTVGGASLDVTANVIDYVGTTSEITNVAATGNLATVDISTLECGGALNLQATGSWQIEGFTATPAKPDGFWFVLSVNNTNFDGTLFNDDATATTTDRMRTSFERDIVGNAIQALVYYQNSRWRVITAINPGGGSAIPAGIALTSTDSGVSVVIVGAGAGLYTITADYIDRNNTSGIYTYGSINTASFSVGTAVVIPSPSAGTTRYVQRFSYRPTTVLATQTHSFTVNGRVISAPIQLSSSTFLIQYSPQYGVREFNDVREIAGVIP